MVGDVHRTALAAAIAGLLAEQLGEHAVDGGALGEAVPVAAMGRGDVVVPPQRLACADCDRLLTDVEVREAGHLRAAIEVVHRLLERADPDHLRVHPQRGVGRDSEPGFRRRRHQRSTFSRPAMRASTS